MTVGARARVEEGVKREVRGRGLEKGKRRANSGGLEKKKSSRDPTRFWRVMWGEVQTAYSSGGPGEKQKPFGQGNKKKKVPNCVRG